MKTLGQQVLILGGFYFITSFLFSLGSGIVFDVFNQMMFVAFIVLLIGLFFKGKYNFLTSLQNKFIKSCNYLLGLGVVQYFATFFIIIPGIFYGYKASQAQYNGLEIPPAPVEYLQIVGYAYWAILLVSLIWATYRNFKK